ncbi:threonylcarbamoyladenosine tRNA methylthiotransferase MtaB [Desulfuromusa kysingii]|uniref:Threonylcarbamoyladenosine tRNA methylthiotransferase MtaB n=1 Tax=Desulfuromusa kysingii TaxID=37625 RepID=A0A1H3YW31_9BACT|nr:tRNA (N(6)-L-threonylcarbamoyladenosine(37)-C(2))-methylthiotransferase MtaB [Desulfuromusa kysingii]SEA15401.1 threonylcarbamoyladenosine tRNA methylthiotransferase MtaB [Desulfuromusa kysingii]
MKTTVSIVTLGCKTNQFESAAMIEKLQQAGYRQVSFEAGADLVIVNTCTVTAATDAQSRKLIRRARRFNSNTRIVVTGCYAQIDPHSLKQMPGVSLVVGNNEKGQLLDYLVANNDTGQIQVSDIRASSVIEPLVLTGFEQRSRAFVQIQNGCDAFCSYCIIPYARGRSRSVPVAAVISQIERLCANGYPEIVLTGIHIGRYGQDFVPCTDLLTLLQKIEKSDFSGRLRLGSIEPTELSEELSHYIAQADWICPHFHIPLQAGDDEILRRMNRHYTTTFFADLLDRLRQIKPDAAIGLDVITGFPGETDVQFQATCQLLRQLPFSHLHVFPYSKRAGTLAAEMPDQVPGDVMKARAAQLRQIGREKNRNFAQQFVGSELEIVIEGGEDDDLRKGLSRNYLPVWVPATSVEPGELLKVRVSGMHKDGLLGSP